jgi:hypothetical protein
MRMPIPPESKILRKLPSKLILKALAAMVVALAGVQVLAAQAPAQTPAAAAPAAAPAHKAVRAVRAHKKPGKGHPAATAEQSAAAPVQPKKPDAPKWPVNEHPGQATVTWDSQGLRIEAANSSLQQILRDVSTATGLKVEGLGADERVFGAYGPGQVRDVLSKLLQGSSYNVMMIGDQGQGAPRQIVLSSRHSGDAQAATNKSNTDADEDDTPDEAEEPPQPPAPQIRPNFSPGNQNRPPQQMPQRPMPPN